MAHEVKGRFVHWVVHMLYTIRKKVLLGKCAKVCKFCHSSHVSSMAFSIGKVLLGKSFTWKIVGSYICQLRLKVG